MAVVHQCIIGFVRNAVVNEIVLGFVLVAAIYVMVNFQNLLNALHKYRFTATPVALADVGHLIVHCVNCPRALRTLIGVQHIAQRVNFIDQVKLLLKDFIFIQIWSGNIELVLPEIFFFSGRFFTFKKSFQILAPMDSGNVHQIVKEFIVFLQYFYIPIAVNII